MAVPSTGSDHICVQAALASGDHSPRLCTRSTEQTKAQESRGGRGAGREMRWVNAVPESRSLRNFIRQHLKMSIYKAETVGEKEPRHTHVSFSLMYMNVKSHRFKVTNGELETGRCCHKSGFVGLAASELTGRDRCLESGRESARRGECADLRSLGVRVFLPHFVTKKRKAFH